jgi:hypothetical protein
VIVELVFVRFSYTSQADTSLIKAYPTEYALLESLLGFAVVNLSVKNKSQVQNSAFFLDFLADTDNYIKLNKLV